MQYEIRQMDSALNNPRHKPRKIRQQAQPTYFLGTGLCRVPYSVALPQRTQQAPDPCERRCSSATTEAKERRMPGSCSSGSETCRRFIALPISQVPVAVAGTVRAPSAATAHGECLLRLRTQFTDGFPRGVGVIPPKLKSCRINGDELDPLIVKQVLEDRVLLNQWRYSACRGFDNRQHPHGLMVMPRPVVDCLQRKAGLKIALAPSMTPTPDTTLWMTLLPLP